jgi:SAM-dependent methyltransferase
VEDNHYRTRVFLDRKLRKDDYKTQRFWLSHQQMQERFVHAQGLQAHHRFLDIGCGPLRLGSVLIPYLRGGHYFGMDINQDTIDLGVSKLREDGVDLSNASFVVSDRFDFSPIDGPVDMAFSNSLFSHLSLNTIGVCLSNLASVLVPGGLYFTTFFLVQDTVTWARPFQRDKWGRKFETHPAQDPFHYTFDMMAAVAGQCGFDCALDDSFGHPTQTMAVLTRR